MSRISKVGASLRPLLSVSMLALSAGCAAGSPPPLEASTLAGRAALAMLEAGIEGEAADSATTADDRTRCAEREEAACFGVGGACELPTAALVACAEARGCFDADGVFDESCAYDRCLGETEAFGTCVYDSCGAYVACFEEAPGPSEETPVEPSACERAAIACVEGPCAASYDPFVVCVVDAGCIDDELGVYDEACGAAACPAETAAYSECIATSCADLGDVCVGDTEPADEPVDCDAAYEACFGAGGSCEAEWTPYASCAEECIDASGVVDDVCAAERCSGEIDALYACLPVCSLPEACS